MYRVCEPNEVIDSDILLFGDGASATAIETADQKSFYYFQKTDGKRHHLLTRSLNGEFYMDGNEILLFSLTEVAQSINDLRNHFQIKEQEIDYYVIHQAQKIILDGMNVILHQKRYWRLMRNMEIHQQHPFLLLYAIMLTDLRKRLMCVYY